MGRLPTLRPREVVAALERAGFVGVRQVGSHLFLRNPRSHLTTVVAMHAGDVKRQVRAAILKQAGLTREEFERLL